MTNLIIDGNNLAYRCKYKFELSNNGVDVSITYGFLKVLAATMRKLGADSTTVTWDYGIPEHRRTALPSYKANRVRSGDPEEYEDMLRQMNELHAILPYFGIVSVRKSACEADDLMYQATKIYTGDSIIVSTDADMLQAISDTCFVYNPSKDTIIEKEHVLEKFGVPVEQYIDWRAIQGDSSDNIRGVVGIGPKTATKLFNKWGTLTGIINACNKGKETSKIAAKLVDFGEDKIFNNIYVMALYADRAGARLALVTAVKRHTRANRGEIKAYLVQNAFMSLFSPDFMHAMTNQTAPIIKTDAHIPVICGDRRYPVE